MIPKVNIPEGKIGNWSVEIFSVSKSDADMDNIRNIFRGGRSVPEGSYTGLYRNGSVIMSDTPDEMRDHRFAVSSAKGNCLILGLGLGMVIAAMLDKPEVTKVTVIDNSLDVIALTGPTLLERYGERIEIIHADAMTWKPPKGERYNCVWADIWDHISGDNTKQMSTLNRRYGRISDWHGNWCEGLCKRENERWAEEKRRSRYW